MAYDCSYLGRTLSQVVDDATLQQMQAFSLDRNLDDLLLARNQGKVGCVLGLQPGPKNSGGSEPRMHTNKEGVAADIDRERTIFWAVLRKTVICGARDGTVPEVPLSSWRNFA